MMASHEVLQAFVQAATQGSFSAAARKLGKSQSTVSAAVANLEIDLDVVLFDRSNPKTPPDPRRGMSCLHPPQQGAGGQPGALEAWPPAHFFPGGFEPQSLSICPCPQHPY